MSPKDDVRSVYSEFLQETGMFFKEFDSILEDRFQGEKCERLALEFIKKHEKYLESFAFPLSELNLQTASSYDVLKDDFRLLNISEEDEFEPSELDKNLAQIYRRASAASYLRITCNKSRKKQEDDRQEPVNWARRAIRHDANNFEVCYWYMIAIGYHLDGLGTSKERIVLSQIFKLATLRCIRLNPEDPLAHHLLGRYYFKVGNLGWLERTIIKSLLLQDSNGQFKIEGSHAEAEQKFLTAHRLKDDWLPTGLWMARVLLAQKRPMQEVSKWIEMGLAHDCLEPTTEMEQRELLELKAKLNL